MSQLIQILQFALPAVIVIATLEGIVIALVMRRDLQLAGLSGLARRRARPAISRLHVPAAQPCGAPDRFCLEPSAVHGAAQQRCLCRAARDRAGFQLLLVPSLQPPRALVLGDACDPSFLERVQPCRLLPLRLDRAADRRGHLLRADDLARLRAGPGVHRSQHQPALPVLAARRVDSESSAGWNMCSTRPRIIACIMPPIRNISTAITAASSSCSIACSGPSWPSATTCRAATAW